MKASPNYKPSYLGNYAINLVFLIPLIVIYWFPDVSISALQNFLEGAVICWTLWTILNLWGHAFLASEGYKGKYTLVRYTVQRMTLSLSIIDFMVIYYAISDNFIFVKASTAATAFWLAALVYLIASRKIFIKSNDVNV